MLVMQTVAQIRAKISSVSFSGASYSFACTVLFSIINIKEEQTFISARPVKSPFVLISVMPCTMKISESYSLTRLLLLPFEKRS